MYCARQQQSNKATSTPLACRLVAGRRGRLLHLRGDFGEERQGARRRRMQGYPMYQPRRRPLYHPTLVPLPAVPTNASHVMPHHPLHVRLRGPTPPACPARRSHHPPLVPLPPAPASASCITPYYPLHSRLCGPAPPAHPARRRGSQRYSADYAYLLPCGAACYAPFASSVLLPRWVRRTHHRRMPPPPRRERPSSSHHPISELLRRHLCANYLPPCVWSPVGSGMALAVELVRGRHRPLRRPPPPPTHRWEAGGSRGIPRARARVGVRHAASARGREGAAR